MSVRRVLGVALAVMLLLPIAALAGLEEYVYQVNAPEMAYDGQYIYQESWNPPVIRGVQERAFGKHEGSDEPFDLMPLISTHTFPDQVLDKDRSTGSTLGDSEWYYLTFAEPVVLREFTYWPTDTSYGTCGVVATVTVEVNDGGQWVPYMEASGSIGQYCGSTELHVNGYLSEFKGYFTYYRVKVHAECVPGITCGNAAIGRTLSAGSLTFKGFRRQDVLDHVAQSQPLDIGYLAQITYLAASVEGDDQQLWPSGPSAIGFLFGDGNGNWYSVQDGQVVQTSLDRILTWIDGLSKQGVASLSGTDLDALKEALGDQMVVAVFLPGPTTWFTWFKVNGYRFLLTEQDVTVEHTVQHQYAPATVGFSVDIAGLPHGAYRPVTVTASYGDDQSGQVSALELPVTFQHQYQEGGVYEATLEIALADGQTLSVPVTVTVNDRAPASFSVTRQTEIDYMPADFQFTATVESPDERNAQLEGVQIT